MALNKVMLIGNVGKDPEVRYLETPEHPKVAQFTLATSERYNAKDYGVPQNRERVFLVSILNDDGIYHFPKPFELDKFLIDVLEPEVDEKYYVSDKAIQGFLAHNENHERKGTGFM